MEKTPNPTHIAFIMDGNRRWAKKRGMPSLYGHKKGVEAFERIVEACIKRKIQSSTFYTFSSENWRRTPEEVSGLISLISSKIKPLSQKGIENGVKYNILGDISRFPEKLQKELSSAVKNSRENEGMILNVALSYGGRAEIVRASRLCCEKGEEITEENIEKYLYTAGQEDPDLIIRTGGEQRLSNFLSWQGVYSELYFVETLWPDFDDVALEAAIEVFKERSRRFGK